MQYWKRTVALILTLALVCILPVCALAEEGTQPEEGPEEGGEEPGGEEPAQDPGQDQEPAQEEEPQEPEPFDPETDLTPVPTTEPTPEETPEPATEAPTPAPTEDAGSVNLGIYVFTPQDTPAAGCTVTIGGYSQSTNAQGLARFENLPVAEYQVSVSGPDGQSPGRWYMSRGSSTVLTDQAMGGTYGMNIASGQHDVYMVVTYLPEEALEIRSLSNSLPSLPAAAAPEPVATEDIEYPAKTVTATFVTEDGAGIPSLGLAVEGNGLSENVTTDARGQVTLRNVPFGSYSVIASMDGTPVAQFSLTMNPALQTAIIMNSAPDFSVDSSVHEQRLFLEFRQAGTTLLLTGASDSPIGGMNSIFLGIAVIAAVIIATIVILLIARKKKRAKRTAPAPKPAGPTIKTNRKYHEQSIAPEDDSLRDVQDGVKRTGGANKFNADSFDDRSRM